jgi:hypothetical protein
LIFVESKTRRLSDAMQRKKTNMHRPRNQARPAVRAALILALALAASCSDDDDSSSSDETTGSETAGASDATSTRYERLGGHTGIRAAVDKVLAQELADPDIASYLFNQLAVTTPPGHPNADQVAECFTYQLANVAGGPEPYPATVTTAAGSWTCRDMVASHKFLHISGGTFAKFVLIATTELQSLGVSADDVATIGSALESTRTDIVDPALADTGTQPYDPNRQ